MVRRVTLDHVRWEASADDQVTTALDGRRLDTREKVLEFIAELEAVGTDQQATADGRDSTID